MKDTKSLKWIIKNGKKEIPKILILSVSNIVLALVSTALALVSKYAIDAAQKAAVSKVQSDFVYYRNQIIFYGKLLSIFGLPVDSIDPRLFGNLALSMMMVHKAIPDTMPFLFPEVAEDMVDFQVRALVDEMERVKEHVR